MASSSAHGRSQSPTLQLCFSPKWRLLCSLSFKRSLLCLLSFKRSFGNWGINKHEPPFGATICWDICPRTLSVPSSEQFSESVARGNKYPIPQF